LFFDHLRDKREPLHLPDAQVTAWKDSDGTVNLTIPHFEEYRMRGPDLLHLKSDPTKIFSSTTQPAISRKQTTTATIGFPRRIRSTARMFIC